MFRVNSFHTVGVTLWTTSMKNNKGQVFKCYEVEIYFLNNDFYLVSSIYQYSF